MKNFFKYLFDCFLNIIYKNNCCICNCSNAENFLCKSCAKTVEFLPCYAQEKINNIEIYSACFYDNVLKTLIQNYKFKNKKDIKKPLAYFLSNYFKSTFKDKNFLIVPVPSHKERIKLRGYDHIMLLAEEFSKITHLPLNKDILIKIKNTKPHYNLKKKEREENIKDSFRVCLKNYNNENILILDDITTTGSTLREVINEFQKNNIKNMVCLTLCKTK